MTVSDELQTMLTAPLDLGRVSSRDAGGGRMVSYLEGWDVIACANAIFGFDGWAYEVIETIPVRSWDLERTNTRTKENYSVTVTLYQARVRVEALGAVRVDVGTSVTSADTAEAHDTAIKGAATDGLKRALRTFGAQFGNSLYDKDGPHEEAQPQSPQTRVQPQQRPQPPQPAQPAPDGPAWGPILRQALADEGIRGQGPLTDYLYQDSVVGPQPNVTEAVEAWLAKYPASNVRNLALAVAQHAKGAVAP